MGLNEADTRAKLIDPIIHKIGWTEDLIRRERTAGAIEVINGNPKRKSGRTDYLLCLPVKSGQNPLAIAIVEAKKEDEPCTLGLDQARDYAKYQHVPFVFSTNGHLFAAYDFLSEKIMKDMPLTQFPAPDKLRELYEQKKEFRLDSEDAKALLVPYAGGQSERRYYQDAAIRAALEKIASEKQGSNRVLLSLATGSGKTRIAVQLLHKIALSGKLKKALFVCDRNELRRQGYGSLFGTFGDNVATVGERNPQKNARIIVATYQSLGLDEEGDQSFFLNNYPKDYFSHIIIDECHRSAWNKWSIILTNNPNAVQIGLTATPRIIVGEKSEERDKDEQISRNNIKYFGEPVYEYNYIKGQEDGYLAALELIRRKVTIDELWLTKEELLSKGVKNKKTGKLLTEDEIKEIYTKKNFDKELVLPERREAMIKDLLKNLEATGGLKQKTIIFCVNDDHARDVAIDIHNLALDMGYKGTKKLVFQFTQKSVSAGTLGESQETLMGNMRGSKSSHFIATTVELLTTGVDLPCVANIVFFSYVASPIQFYQMFGRGTRIEPIFDKFMFRVYDYTNASRLFGKDFISKPRDSPSKPSKKKKETIIAEAKGFSVQVKPEGTFIIMKDKETGKEKPVPVEEYQADLAVRLVKEAQNIDLLREMWINPDSRKHLVSALPGGEQGAYILRSVLNLDDCDLFDLCANVGFGIDPKSRKERVIGFGYKNSNWLNSLPTDAAAVINEIAKQFSKEGIEELENENIWNIPSVKRAGGFNSIEKFTDDIKSLIVDVKKRILAA
jgi:type I restriction enzyme R subunit